jgi:hypothetical protein
MSQESSGAGTISLKLPPVPEASQPAIRIAAPQTLNKQVSSYSSSPLSPSRSYDSLARQVDVGPVNLPEQGMTLWFV